MSTLILSVRLPVFVGYRYDKFRSAHYTERTILPRGSKILLDKNQKIILDH